MFFHCTFYHSHHSVSISETTNKVRDSSRDALSTISPDTASRCARCAHCACEIEYSCIWRWHLFICSAATRPPTPVRHRRDLKVRPFLLFQRLYFCSQLTHASARMLFLVHFFRNDFFFTTQTNRVLALRFGSVSFGGQRIYLCWLFCVFGCCFLFTGRLTQHKKIPVRTFARMYTHTQHTHKPHSSSHPRKW